MTLPKDAAVLSCKVFAPELTFLGLPPERVIFLEQGLHDHPRELRQRAAQALARLEAVPALRTVVLLYGYCGGGLEGLTARRVRLVAPLAHDCIPVLLGRYPPSPNLASAGSFHLSAGWVEHGQTPYTEFRRTCQRYDPATALWISKEIMRGYRQVNLIHAPGVTQAIHRSYARQMAQLFGLGYGETPGCLAWLRRVLAGTQGQGVLLAPPGRPLTMSDYLEAARGGGPATPRTKVDAP